MSRVIFPFINTVDLVFALFLPLTLRISLWGLLAGLAATAVYAFTSNQESISILKLEIKNYKSRMLDPSVESHSEFVALAGENFKTSAALLGKVLGPALLSALPVLVIAVWMDTYHGYAMPEGSAAIALTFVPPVTGMVKISPPELARVEGGTVAIVPPQSHPATVSISVNDMAIYSGDPFRPPAPVIAKRGWLNLILPSGNGYVHPDAPIKEIHLDLLKMHLYRGLPSWASGWELTYFFSVFVAALVSRLVFKIH